MRSVMRHEARQVPSWLISDVRQNQAMGISRLMLAVTLLLCGCTRLPDVDVSSVVGDAALILVLAPQGETTNYRVLEILKNDGSAPKIPAVGDQIRGVMKPSSARIEAVVAIVGRKDLGGELAPMTGYSEYAVIRGRVRALNDVSLEELRMLTKKMPNKTPEPTPGAVTPRATEGASK